MELNIEKLLDEALVASKNGEHSIVELVSEPGAGKTKKVLAWAEEKGVQVCRLSIEMYTLLQRLDADNIMSYFAMLANKDAILFLDDLEKMPENISVMIKDGNIGLGSFLFTVKAETKR